MMYIHNFNNALVFLTVGLWGGLSINGEKVLEEETQQLDVKGILGGGREVSLGEFPWAVGLMEAESGKLICGGSILTETFILTAGRCVHRWLENGTVGQVSPSFISVIAGDNIRGQGEGTEQIIAVERIIVHPGFQFDETYQTPPSSVSPSSPTKEFSFSFHHDIALLQLSSPLNFSSGSVQPITHSHGGLSFQSSFPTPLTIVGWGVTDKRQNPIPTGKSLKAAFIPFYREAKLPGRYGLFPQTEDTSLIGFNSGIGQNKGLMGRCIGDPGSALLCPKISEDLRSYSHLLLKEYELCGVLTFGIWCDKHSSSGQITNLKFYEEWIDSHIKSYVLQAYLAILVVAIILGTIGIVSLSIHRKKTEQAQAYRV